MSIFQRIEELSKKLHFYLSLYTETERETVDELRSIVLILKGIDELHVGVERTIENEFRATSVFNSYSKSHNYELTKFISKAKKLEVKKNLSIFS